MGNSWRRVRKWINRPDPQYAVKKRRDWLSAQAQAHEAWRLGEEDESWFSRFVQPAAHAGPGISLKLVQREPTHGEQAKALACFGALRHDTRQVELYFAPGQPKSEPMGVFLMGLLAFARQEGKRVLVVIWDNARWHKSARIRQWIHNRENALANHACLLICCPSIALG